jgi:hypothetical protein
MSMATSCPQGAAPGVSIRLAGLRGFPFQGGRLRLDLAALLGPLFFMWLLQLPLPLAVGQLVGAKERGTRGLMALQVGGGGGGGCWLHTCQLQPHTTEVPCLWCPRPVASAVQVMSR